MSVIVQFWKKLQRSWPTGRTQFVKARIAGTFAPRADRSARVRHYAQCILARDLEAAEHAWRGMAAVGEDGQVPLWSWRLLHLARAGDQSALIHHIATRPKGADLPLQRLQQVVSACEIHRMTCGPTLRRLFLANLSDSLDVPEMLKKSFHFPRNFNRKRIERIVAMRQNLGVATGDDFASDCKKASVLNSLLLCYAMDGADAGFLGRDRLLPFTDIQHNPEWENCLRRREPFVLAGFHAGPLVDLGWVAKDAHIPVFHFARDQGCRNSRIISTTADMTPFAFVDIARKIVDVPSGVIISPDVGNGLRGTGLEIGGNAIALSPIPGYLAFRSKARVFFAVSRWHDHGIGIEIMTGPRCTPKITRGAWEAAFNEAYVGHLTRIVSGPALDNLRF